MAINAAISAMTSPSLIYNLSTIINLLAVVTGPTVILLFITNVCLAIVRDYKTFLSLGPGGTPSTPVGYIRVKFLGLFALTDPYKPVPVPTHFKQQAGYLSRVRSRPGDRPLVRGIAPHRQANQQAPAEIFTKLRESIEALAVAHPDNLIEGTSCLEKHGPGLFVPKAQHWTPHCNGEVCHAHPSDGSLHLTLHPADAAIVLKAKRGEKHPLSSGGWLKRFVPAGFIMVYAPRTEEEVKIVMEIVNAAIWWVGGQNLNVSTGNVSDSEHASVLDGAEKEDEVIDQDWLGVCAADAKQSALMK
jgi:hypothetical protein